MNQLFETKVWKEIEGIKKDIDDEVITAGKGLRFLDGINKDRIHSSTAWKKERSLRILTECQACGKKDGSGMVLQHLRQPLNSFTLLHFIAFADTEKLGKLGELNGVEETLCCVKCQIPVQPRKRTDYYCKSCGTKTKEQTVLLLKEVRLAKSNPSLKKRIPVSVYYFKGKLTDNSDLYKAFHLKYAREMFFRIWLEWKEYFSLETVTTFCRGCAFKTDMRGTQEPNICYGTKNRIDPDSLYRLGSDYHYKSIAKEIVDKIVIGEILKK